MAVKCRPVSWKKESVARDNIIYCVALKRYQKLNVLRTGADIIRRKTHANANQPPTHVGFAAYLCRENISVLVPTQA